jgi:ribose transport system ATP-binding protein
MLSKGCAGMSSELLRLENINYQLDNFHLSNINIDLFENEIHVIMGENGAGKSLMMQIISGLVTPDSGAIYIRNQLVRNRSFSTDLFDDVIYIRQDATMLVQLSIAENLFFNKLPYKNRFLKSIDYDKLNYMCQQLIDDLGLPVSVFDKVASLGFAQRQIIEFCRAYISDAPVVILDEPSSALTQSERALLYRIVKKIKSKGAGIFYITHCLEDVSLLGDRVTVIKNGSIVGTKIVSECSQEEIIKMLSGRYIKNRYPKIVIQKGKNILSVRNLGFSDKLLNINLDLCEGDILGITGLAGSGRTLLANCLFGAVDGVAGEVKLNGLPIKIDSPYKAICNGIALIPENRLTDSIFGYLNISNNVAVSSLKRFSNFSMINTTYLEQAVADYVEKLNIPHTLHSNIMEYTGGNQQKAIFAKWIMSRAKIFILDEPTRGLDIASKVDIYNSINDLIKKKAGIIFISSDIEEILGVCDRVAVLANRTCVCNVPTKEITVEKIIELSTGKEQ